MCESDGGRRLPGVEALNPIPFGTMKRRVVVAIEAVVLLLVISGQGAFAQDARPSGSLEAFGSDRDLSR
jgi:hypothetical protein